MPKISSSDKDLIRRYLLWCYKTTKESLDRVDRKFTQVAVDRLVLKHLKGSTDGEYLKKLREFEMYLENKEREGLDQKFVGADKKNLKPDYLYLQNRLKAVEKVIIHFLGGRALTEIKVRYEQEMTRRILESREH